MLRLFRALISADWSWKFVDDLKFKYASKWSQAICCVLRILVRLFTFKNHFLCKCRECCRRRAFHVRSTTFQTMRLPRWSQPSIRNYDALKISLRTNYNAKRFFIAQFTSIDSFVDDCRGGERVAIDFYRLHHVANREKLAFQSF